MNYKHQTAAFLLMITSYCSLFGQVEKPIWPNDKVTEETFYTIGTQAYIYSVTPFMMYSVLYQSQQVPYPGYPAGTPFNVWTMMTELANASNSRTVMPNVNTLYASSWLTYARNPYCLIFRNSVIATTVLDYRMPT